MANRRAFLKDALKASAAVAGTLALPGAVGAANPPGLRVPRPRRGGRWATPDPKELAARAIEAARKAGATYADVRLTYDWWRSVSSSYGGEVHDVVYDTEQLNVGVRVLVDGYWGFLSSPYWTPDEMARLGTEAVAVAKSSGLGKPRRVVELGKIPVVRDGQWVAPIERDPTTIPVNEVLDFTNAFQVTNTSVGHVVFGDVVFQKQEKVFASTEGSLFTQTTYDTAVTMSWGGPYVCRVPVGRAWEALRADEPNFFTSSIYPQEKLSWSGPEKALEVGKYDVVFDAWSMAAILGASLSGAIQLDRALGYEANASGTSYLNDPLAMLGTYQFGSPLVTVVANRSAPGAAATVQWDDEGVVPQETTLVKDGVLMDFPTTRESAGWLAERYTKQGRPVRSNGSARGMDASCVPMAHAPNLTLMPGKQEQSFEDLVANLESGLAVKGGGLDMDYQSLNGLMGPGIVYEIKKGKPVAHVGILDFSNGPEHASVSGQGNFLFRSPQFWQGIEALGGPASTLWNGGHSYSRLGQPEQIVAFDTRAVPARVKQLAFIDPKRKA